MAAARLNGAVIPADATFSFWKQIGKATARRGFAHGRLLREGCLMPAVGGGLCQLSNALYDAALLAGMDITERWAHSQTIPGSAAAVGRDATVAWNYIDLRFRPQYDLRITACLTAEELVIRFGSRKQRRAAPLIPQGALLAPALDTEAHSCTSCGEARCFRHATGARHVAALESTVWIMDENWPELGSLVPATAPVLTPRSSARLATLHRSAAMRLARGGPAKRAAHLHASVTMSTALSRRIPLEARHIVVPQSLLAALCRTAPWADALSMSWLPVRLYIFYTRSWMKPRYATPIESH